MAGSFQRICTYPGCTKVQFGPRCEAHAYPPRPDKRESASTRGYDRDWRALRDWYIERHPICEIKVKCDGRPAVLVDHIKPISKGGERLDERNLQSSCRACHDWKTSEIDQVRRPK